MLLDYIILYYIIQVKGVALAINLTNYLNMASLSMLGRRVDRCGIFKRFRRIPELLEGTRQPVATPELSYSTGVRLYCSIPRQSPFIIHQYHKVSLVPLLRHGWYGSRGYSSHSNRWRTSNRQTLTYVAAVAITVVGLSYAAVPLYRIYCQVSMGVTNRYCLFSWQHLFIVVLLY